MAADDAWFSDHVARMGIGGVEYHGHTWELGARRAKDLLFTGRRIGAEQAEKLGMVNCVVPRDELVERTLALANEIAEMHPFALAQISSEEVFLLRRRVGSLRPGGPRIRSCRPSGYPPSL